MIYLGESGRGDARNRRVKGAAGMSIALRNLQMLGESAMYGCETRTDIRRTVPRLLAVILASLVAGAALGSSNAYAANGSVTYTYDALGRVTTASYDTGVIVIYTYDSNGNRTAQVINVNTAPLTWTATYTPCTTNCWGSSLW